MMNKATEIEVMKGLLAQVTALEVFMRVNIEAFENYPEKEIAALKVLRDSFLLAVEKKQVESLLKRG